MQADADDYWAKAVTLFTGYTMPSRKTLFNDLKSKEGVPLFRHGIHDQAVRPVQPADYAALTGRNVRKGEDYDLVFYTSKGGDGAHGGVRMKQVRVVLIGVFTDENGRATLFEPGEVMVGSTFNSSVKEAKVKNDWDTTPMSRYIFGGRAALDALLTDHSTKGFSFSGQSVSDLNAVDLTSFTRTARAFDRAKKFFADQANTLEQWDKSLGEEQASWKGQAAGVFQNLIHQMYENYENYVDQLGGKDYKAAHKTIDGYLPSSEIGDAVAQAQRNLVDQATGLRKAWSTWESSREHDPHRAVLDVLNDLWKWVVDNNITQVNRTRTTAPKLTIVHHTTAAFRQHHPEYGDLATDAAWKKVGEAAVAKWNRQVERFLTPTGTTALSGLNNQWLNVATAFEEPLETKKTSTLSEAFQQEQTELSQKKLDETNQDLAKAVNGISGSLADLNTGMGGSLKSLNSALSDFGTEPDTGVSTDTSLDDGPRTAGTDTTTDTSLNGSPTTQTGLEGSPATDTGLNTTDSGFGTTDTGLNTTDSGFGTTDSGLNTTDSGQSAASEGKVSSLTNSDGSTTKLNSDGSLTTTYPDGSLSVLNPATGMLTTTSADGRTSGEKLTPGAAVTHADGSTTTLNPDGTLTTTYPDGTSTVVDPSTGKATTTQPDGSVTTTQITPSADTVTNADGSTTRLNSDGSLTTTNSDGSTETYNPDTGKVTTTSPDGTTSTGSLNSGLSYTNPDGSTTALNSDGTLTTKFPDGTVQSVDPNGTVTTTKPDGSVTTTQLSPSADTVTTDDGSTTQLNSEGSVVTTASGGGSGGSGSLTTSLTDLASLSGGSSSQSGVFGSSLLDSAGGAGGADSTPYEEYDGTPYTGGALGAPTTGATDAAAHAQSGGVPLNPGAFNGMGGMGGMGAMGGMGGMGGSGSGQSNSERVRNVLSESDGATLRRPKSRSRAAGAADEEEEDVVFTRGGVPTAGSSPYAPMGGQGAQGGQSTQSGDRERSGWVPEDEDVWGTDEGGAPAVIGR
ncbi:AAWKG family protein [Streptomyces sp. NPDC060000]|uniref:AAWKG family protein n=1 Tax=Streptomyces sp. NPDC060000 TaxID=3347031 RepID=UPI00368B7FA0